MGSTRLPGKVLMKINHQSILENLVERIRPSKIIDQVIIATTTNTEDDAIEKLCAEKNWNCFRGSDWDVLSRFYNATKQFEKAENIIRITSDCPLHSYKVIDFVVAEFQKSGKEYFSNSNNEPHFLEDGFDTEVFSFRALETAHTQAKKLSEREHVTPYIKNSGKFSCGWGRYNSGYTYKLSVDSPEDFAAVKQIFEELKEIENFGMNEVITLLKNKPEILELNKNSVANSGYIKSIQNDTEIEK
jgi:spore coat polysaccharide biosynthesis protein SpsF